MLKKLYKHELYSLFRILLPIYFSLFGFAVLSRLSYFFDTDNKLLSVVRNFSVVFYVFSILAVFFVGFALVIVRFYKNLLSHEGYLTFTLPFTATQHIVCKSICGFIVVIVNFIVTALSLLVLAIDTIALEAIYKVLKESFKIINAEFSTGDIILVAFEIALLTILTTFQGLLMFYASMAIGQKFKNKIAGAFISYVCIYAAIQVIATTVFLPIAITNGDKINEYLNSSMQAFQILLAILIIWSLILSTLYFFTTRHYLTNKLNLE